MLNWIEMLSQTLRRRGTTEHLSVYPRVASISAEVQLDSAQYFFEKAHENKKNDSPIKLQNLRISAELTLFGA
jgi:hypothetical protein